MILAVFDTASFFQKLFENSTVAAAIIAMTVLGLRYLSKRDEQHAAVIRDIVHQVRENQEQMREAVDCLRAAVQELTIAVDIHRAKTENGHS